LPPSGLFAFRGYRGIGEFARLGRYDPIPEDPLRSTPAHFPLFAKDFLDKLGKNPQSFRL
jgi:hypothetical protein